MDKEDEDVIFIDARGYKAKIHPSITSGGGLKEATANAEMCAFLKKYPYDEIDGGKTNMAGIAPERYLTTVKGVVRTLADTISSKKDL